MPPKKSARVKTPSILEATPVVILGDIDELAPTSLSEPDTLSETLLPIEPESFEYYDPNPDPFDDPIPIPSQVEQGKAPALAPTQIRWTAEMLEALVEDIYRLFQAGRSSDNGFKKDAWTEVAAAIRRVYHGPWPLHWEKCKNKWGDYKEKWKHWKHLSEQSGFGWNDEKERYEAPDYVWDNLNRSMPRILWHKTHVMPHRDIFTEVLHDNSMATGRAAISGLQQLQQDELIDPQLLNDALNDSTTPSRTSTPQIAPKPIVYNKSKKRVRIEGSDDEDTPAAKKKVDLGAAIIALTSEMAIARQSKSEQSRAVELLETHMVRGLI